MEISKTIIAFTVLTSLVVGLAPKPAVCQMTNLKAISCKIPCCKSTQKAPACPLMKPAPTEDIIGTSFLSPEPILLVVATIYYFDYLAQYNESPRFDPQPQIPKSACSTPQSIPAPPALA